MPKFRVDTVTQRENYTKVFEGEDAEQAAWAYAQRQTLRYRGTPGLSVTVEPVEGEGE